MILNSAIRCSTWISREPVLIQRILIGFKYIPTGKTYLADGGREIYRLGCRRRQDSFPREWRRAVQPTDPSSCGSERRRLRPTRSWRTSLDAWARQGRPVVCSPRALRCRRPRAGLLISPEMMDKIKLKGNYLKYFVQCYIQWKKKSLYSILRMQVCLCYWVLSNFIFTAGLFLLIPLNFTSLRII